MPRGSDNYWSSRPDPRNGADPLPAPRGSADVPRYYSPVQPLPGGGPRSDTTPPPAPRDQKSNDNAVTEQRIERAAGGDVQRRWNQNTRGSLREPIAGLSSTPTTPLMPLTLWLNTHRGVHLSFGLVAARVIVLVVMYVVMIAVVVSMTMMVLQLAV